MCLVEPTFVSFQYLQKNFKKFTKVNKFLVIKIPGYLGGKGVTDADYLDEYEHFHMLPQI